MQGSSAGKAWTRARWALGALMAAGCVAPAVTQPPDLNAPRKGTASASPAPGATKVPSATPGNVATPTPGTGTPGPVSTGTPGGQPTASPGGQATATPGPVGTPTPQGYRFETSPLTRFNVLYGYDRLSTWVPGEIIRGPVHINRGPIAADPAIRDANAKTPGRSTMNVQADRIGYPSFDGREYPEFHAPVTMSYLAGADRAVNPLKLADPDSWLQIDTRKSDGDAPTVAPEMLARIFQDPFNAAGFGDRPGPVLVPQEIPLPGPLSGRLGAVMGLAAGASPASLPWFANLPDGVYLPTQAMTTGGATGYQKDAAVSGGIYVRGDVAVLRGAVRGDVSYYLFGMGFPGAAGARVYAVRMDRRALTTQLVSIPLASQRRLATVLTEGGNDPQALFTGPATETGELARWGLSSSEDKLSMTFTAAPGAIAPFNGVIAVDYSRNDPVRNPANPETLRPATASLQPASGHVLALGDPAYVTKTPLGGAADLLPVELRAADVFSTEVPGSAGAQATGLTIMTAGYAYIQNHLIVAGIPAALGQPATAEALVASLTKGELTAAGTHDRMAVWSDRQVIFGLAAPSVPDRKRIGLLLTASLVATEDPGVTQDLFSGGHTHRDEVPGSYRGSFATEGLISAYGVIESYDVPTGGFYDHDVATAGKSLVYQYDSKLPADALPNAVSRGRLCIFGAMVGAKRGVIGQGNLSYDRDHLFDARLGLLPPPLVP